MDSEEEYGMYMLSDEEYLDDCVKPRNASVMYVINYRANGPLMELDLSLSKTPVLIWK